ncbi:MAG: acetyltransferase [Actinomycetota bacterium]|nr:acetyltransferase [Actinomycetota bacterium]
MKNKIYIIGAGGHGQVVLDTLLQSGLSPVGFLDDNVPVGEKILDIPVIGKISLAKNLDGQFIVAIGDNTMRKRIVGMLQFSDEKYFSVIHPSVILSKNVKIGVGSMIIGGVVINIGTVIGKHTIINTSVSIDHHNIIGDFVHIAPGVHTGGNVIVKDGAFVGLGCSVISGKEIGKWAVVGAGAAVISNVPDHSVSVGVPAKVIKGQV